MAVIDELVTQITNPDLRARIAAELEKIAKQKKFGLVFEEHLPECTTLWDIPVKKGSKVALKAGQVSDFYTVLKIEDGIATCLNKDKSGTAQFVVDELVCIAEFGEPIYPFLKPLDNVCNAPDSELWHTLIEADNYHALQLLEYLYAGKVDCIYIDPPYNTGARDWKYNNDFVDNTDQYRHSKWLSMMQKRLRIAKKLLNPKDSVLIVTIDEKEYLHLGCLLEEMFPEASMQMISSCINYTATARRNQFDRVNEYIFILMLGDSQIFPQDESKNFKQDDEVNWRSLRRQNATNIRDLQHPNQFYPIYISTKTNTIVKVGENLPFGVPIETAPSIDGCETVFPIKDNGTEMMWGIKRNTFLDRLSKGYVKVGKHTPEKPQKYVLSFLEKGMVDGIANGDVIITGKRADGSVIAVYNTQRKVMSKTQWTFKSHDAREYGTYLLDRTIGEKRFSYPKSLYAVMDCLKYFVAEKKDALIVDFFAGSGTTLHAVNLLNAEDDGHRRCILVTNNEVSDAEAKEMASRGLKPGDEEWENLGIARYVTWPRTVCSIEGHDVNSNPLKGNYLGSDLPMADGFKANAAYFKLGFLDKNAVALGRQFKEMLSTLWMKVGAHGPCPTIGEETPDMLILPENRFAVLVDEKQYMEFAEKLDAHPEIETVFIVTDSESGYRDMIAGLDVKASYQLYRDYLDNFRINAARR